MCNIFTTFNSIFSRHFRTKSGVNENETKESQQIGKMFVKVNEKKTIGLKSSKECWVCKCKRQKSDERRGEGNYFWGKVVQETCDLFYLRFYFASQPPHSFNLCCLWCFYSPFNVPILTSCSQIFIFQPFYTLKTFSWTEREKPEKQNEARAKLVVESLKVKVQSIFNWFSWIDRIKCL